MRFRTIGSAKAVPAVLVGIAFFLGACQIKPSVEKAPERKPPEDLFVFAEGYWQRGQWPEALEAYKAFLEQYPEDKKSPLALHRVAEIALRSKEYGEALKILREIREEFPGYEGLPGVHYEIARCLYLLGDHEASKEEALKWLNRFGRHEMREKVLYLLGEDFEALGDRLEAFRWWLLAEQEGISDLPLRTQVRERLEKIIAQSPIGALESMAEYATGTDFAPKIFYRMAVLLLEDKDLEGAKEMAMALVRSTSEQAWVSKGRDLLERIQAEMSVRPGVVGCLLPLSGPFAIYGEEVLRGIQLGMGLFGDPAQSGPVELAVRDTKGSPQVALEGLEELVQKEKVTALIGPLSSRTAVSVAEKAQEIGVPIITLTQKEGITEIGDMVFRNFLTPSREVDRILDATLTEMGLRRYALLYPDNTYGRFFMNLFWDRLQEMGGEVTGVETYDPEQTDFADQIKKMTGLFFRRPPSLVRERRAMRPPEQEECEIEPEKPEPIVDFDAVFIPDNYQRVAMIAPQLLYHEVVDVLLMGTSLWQSPKLLELAGDYVQEALFTSGFFANPDDPEVMAFLNAYRADFDSTPGILAAIGYDTVRLVSRILSREGLRTRRDFQEGLFECKGFSGVTGEISFSPQGEVETQPLLLTIAGGGMALFQ